MQLDTDIIKSALTDCVAQVFVFDEIDSTNLQAERMIKGEADGRFAIIADKQTDGRGRQGKSFYSPGGTGIYLTAAVEIDVQLNEAVTVTSAAAVAVAEALAKFGAKPEIKWVNDIYIGDRKACGILTKAVRGYSGRLWVIIGVGVNVTTEDFPDDIKDTAVSVGGDVDRNLLAAEILSNIFAVTSDLSDRSYMERYRELSNVIGREIYFVRNGEKTEARAIGIDDDGGLTVETRDGTETLTSGEITVRFNKGR